MTLAAHDPWTRRLARLDTRLDRHVGEAVRVEPMVRGDHRVGVDPARPEFQTVGVLTIRRGDTDLGGNTAQLRNAQLRTSPTELAIMRDKLPAGAVIKKGDRIVALATGATYTVERLDREHEGRVVFVLSADGGGA